MSTNASATEAKQAFSEHDILRSQQWGLIGSVLAAPPKADTIAAFAGLEGDDTALGQAYAVLARAAAEAVPKDV
jgi:TorA maturation chaperone TorD